MRPPLRQLPWWQCCASLPTTTNFAAAAANGLRAPSPSPTSAPWSSHPDSRAPPCSHPTHAVGTTSAPIGIPKLVFATLVLVRLVSVTCMLKRSFGVLSVDVFSRSPHSRTTSVVRPPVQLPSCGSSPAMSHPKIQSHVQTRLGERRPSLNAQHDQYS